MSPAGFDRQVAGYGRVPRHTPPRYASVPASSDTKSTRSCTCNTLPAERSPARWSAALHPSAAPFVRGSITIPAPSEVDSLGSIRPTELAYRMYTPVLCTGSGRLSTSTSAIRHRSTASGKVDLRDCMAEIQRDVVIVQHCTILRAQQAARMRQQLRILPAHAHLPASVGAMIMPISPEPRTNDPSLRHAVIQVHVRLCRPLR